eukprot:9832953-Karenia_brevis.AAC.1
MLGSPGLASAVEAGASGLHGERVRASDAAGVKQSSSSVITMPHPASVRIAASASACSGLCSSGRPRLSANLIASLHEFRQLAMYAAAALSSEKVPMLPPPSQKGCCACAHSASDSFVPANASAAVL